MMACRDCPKYTRVGIAKFIMIIPILIESYLCHIVQLENRLFMRMCLDRIRSRFGRRDDWRNPVYDSGILGVLFYFYFNDCVGVLGKFTSKRRCKNNHKKEYLALSN